MRAPISRARRSGRGSAPARPRRAAATGRPSPRGSRRRNSDLVNDDAGCRGVSSVLGRGGLHQSRVLPAEGSGAGARMGPCRRPARGRGRGRPAGRAGGAAPPASVGGADYRRRRVAAVAVLAVLILLVALYQGADSNAPQLTPSRRRSSGGRARPLHDVVQRRHPDPLALWERALALGGRQQLRLRADVLRAGAVRGGASTWASATWRRR